MHVQSSKAGKYWIMDDTKVSFVSKMQCYLNSLCTVNPTIIFHSLSSACWEFFTLRGISKGIPVLHKTYSSLGEVPQFMNIFQAECEQR